ncbi:MAG TPA: 16S rRNA (guanine(527)-N(7))-methyltransferase RsmG [Polyangia bacterium]|nr:16S rRNA (guanine(527)-N(7))-methyltransferase RsmG [Polyangia bacterium]
MDTTLSRALTEGAHALGIPLDDQALARFATYLALLQRWNARINLTRITQTADILSKHFLDSLAIVPHLGTAQTLIDVGSGAGFPGVPAAIARPGLAVTLLESIQKKGAFLEALRRDLQLPLTVVTQRLEHFVPPAPGFDVAVSRATLAPEEWALRGASLVAPEGLLIAMLGRERPPLPTPPGFSAPELIEYTLPTDSARALALWRRLPS